MRASCLADLSCRSRAPAPPPYEVLANTATSPGLLRRTSLPAFLCCPAGADACAVEVALALELGEVCVEGECAVGSVGWERDLCWLAEK